jgi:hypothetical protein
MLAHHRAGHGHAGPRRVRARFDGRTAGRRDFLQHDLAVVRRVADIGDRDGELNVRPSVSAEWIEANLAATAGDLGKAGRDSEFGYGLLDYRRLADAQ